MSMYLLAPLIAWFIAQGAKYVLDLLHSRSPDKVVFLRSGDMPSAHSAVVISIGTVIALKDGLDSGLFGLAFVFALIVLYDAVNVRRSVGEQGQILAKLAPKAMFKQAKGHLLPEILVGSLIGLFAGYIVMSF
jgi:acid phosphatase family membrane protein YuiD